MILEDKDRLGNKLRELEKAREDQYAAERDRELLEKLRQKKTELRHAASEATVTMGVMCPRCHRGLRPEQHRGVTVMMCPEDHGAWFDQEALKIFLEAPK
ncbi:MAG: zf-TFIIB domain-containing protein [Candidatus Binataceae bacterium]|jgi:hypothetical protein